MCETLAVAKLQHSILNRLQKPSLFLTISILKFSFLSTAMLILLFENMLPQSNAYANIRIIACFFWISSHYLLHCSNYSEEQLALLNTIRNIDMSILQLSDSKFTSVLLFGDTSFDNNKNTFILDVIIGHTISTGSFDVPLFNSSWLAFVSLAL